jgi:hypothetical protein
MESSYSDGLLEESLQNWLAVAAEEFEEFTIILDRVKDLTATIELQERTFKLQFN